MLFFGGDAWFQGLVQRFLEDGRASVVSKVLGAVVLGLSLLLAACALVPPQEARSNAALPQKIDDGVERQWWAARFRVYWPLAVEEPDWAADHLLAHAVVAPVLETYAPRIPLWRFHRRAARDAAGHQFSFIFYSDAVTAESVLSTLEKQPATQVMLAAGFVEKFHEYSSAYPQREQVQATSDKSWSPSMQRNWPVYIMGVSALWLGLIDEQASTASRPTDAAGLLRHYRSVGEKMNAQWREEGLHALIHHLSATFGYVPLPVGEQEVRF